MSLQFIKPKADLVYGASGTSKTSQIGKALEYVLEKTGRTGRLVTADPGGYGPLDVLVNLGLLDVWVIQGWPNFIDIADKACQGYWPKEPGNPKSELLPPDKTDWTKVGFYGIEGLTSIGDAINRRLRDTRAKLSQDPSYVWSEGGNTTSYSGGNMSYYGFVQDRLYEWVCKSHLLPTVKTLWTALEARGEEEGTRIPLYGPAIAGKKSIGKATSWFCNSLHTEAVVMTETVNAETKQVEQATKLVMYLRNHADPLTKIVFPCKTREVYQLAGKMPVFLDPPDIGELYRTLDKLDSQATELMRGRVEKMLADRAAMPAAEPIPPSMPSIAASQPKITIGVATPAPVVATASIATKK